MEHCPPPQLPWRDPPLDRAVHLCLLHLQNDRLPQCAVPCLCGPPPDQGLRDTHPGETEHEEVEEQPGIPGLYAENLKTYSLHLLALYNYIILGMVEFLTWNCIIETHARLL